VYSVPADNSDFSLFRVPGRNFGEERKHDPLVMISSFFAGKSNLSFDQRISILESMFDSRHQAQDRLWSGKDLYTEAVQTTARIWPQFSIAYTEKVITVTNAASRSRNNQEEGIYTFHLPEGSVVTALSLWIEGKEEKGILTTKEKADQAYKTIVGYERRDPSVVHWQEGNTVSLRVFPVLSGGSRKFKIGITSPLRNVKDQLVYENIYFDGPNASSATEIVELSFEHSPKDFIVPAVFTSEGSNSFKRSGKYMPDWSVPFSTGNVSTGSFSFDGKVYSVRPYQKQRASADIRKVYLDINNSWTKDEFDSVLQLLGDKDVFVYHNNELVQVNTKNKDWLYAEISAARFSIFPFFKVNDVSNSLVITKSTTVSPNTGDLTDSRFMKSLKDYLSTSDKIRLFNIGPELCPYLKTLKEYRVFQYEHGDIQLLKSLLANNHFAQDIENDQQVVIDNAELAIVQSDGVMRSDAPDHLMRLFSYNHILQKMGTRLLTTDSLNTDLVEEAKKAYVVSPVSSLIVLETQKDYERFNIHDSNNSLKNASANSKGAVPEPHEWALIIIAVMVLLYLRFQPVIKLK
jgi:XrtN system VIT domain protein